MGLAAFGLAGCDLGPDYSRPTLDVPAAFRAPATVAGGVWPSPDWWQGFHSATLNDLIRRAETHNFDIAAAVARVRQADAQVRIAGAALLPQVSGNAGATWMHEGLGTLTGGGGRRSSNASVDFRQYSFGVNASYQLDFWGRNQAARQAATASAMYDRFDRETVALSVVTNVATTWFTALSLADRLAVARRNLEAAESTLGVIRGRFAAGTASALDVAQQEALAAGERALIPSFQNQIEQELIALGIQVGEPPERIDARPDTLTRLDLPPVKVGLPADLLARRPDVAAAEALLLAQNFNIKVARAAFFPSVSLTGGAGYQAATFDTLVNPGSALANAAAGLLQPIFDGGILRGQLELAKGRYDELLANYRKTVVQAFSDVDNALTAFHYATLQEALQRDAVAKARRAATIARAQLGVGTADITTVLTAETTEFGDEDTLVQVRLARVQALLNLYNALGGGWVEPAQPINAQFPGLRPGLPEGGVALPLGGNLD